MSELMQYLQVLPYIGYTQHTLLEKGRPLKCGRYEKIRTGRKIQRNESCPCGSGKKYKRCCMIK